MRGRPLISYREFRSGWQANRVVKGFKPNKMHSPRCLFFPFQGTRGVLLKRQVIQRVLALFFICFSQGSLSYSQAPTADQLHCDSAFSTSPNCRAVIDTADQDPTQTAPPANTVNNIASTPQVYVDSAGTGNRRANAPTTRVEAFIPPEPLTDFQKLARSASGELLPIFGRDLFQRVPSTFAPTDRVPVTPDYVVGPGDEILVRLSGPESFNSQLTVDTSGAIYIPKVGTIHVAGFRYNELQKQIASEVDRVFRNYNLSVDLGSLRSIQIYVVGEARKPGAYMVSAFSTVLNALFASGGPNAQGSLRHIVIRRASQAPMEFDLYDLVLHGDQTRDIRLQQGDTLFIPATGPQVALAGSVRHPAIYEIKDETTVERLIDLAGGLSSTASRNRISLDRIDAAGVRGTLSIKLDDAGRQIFLRDGDVVFAEHISAGFEKTVTIRGYLASPGRFPWHEGLRLSDIIPERKSLLSPDYWRERNRLGVPTPLFEPTENGRSEQLTNLRPGGSLSSYGSYGEERRSNTQTGGNSTPLASDVTGGVSPSRNSVASASTFLGVPTGAAPATSVGGAIGNPDPTAPLIPSGENGQRMGTRQPIRIDIPVAEIDWSYAVIERLNPDTLRNSLIPFNLGRLVQEHDARQDILLQPGDVVTILSQADVHVPEDEQTKYVHLEGEFLSSGVYSVGPHETLDQLVQRAGGLSGRAYLYGSSFLRESARVLQQQRLDEYISTLSADMERSAATRAASTSSGILDPNALLEQRTLITQLRQVRATGRIVLEFRPDSAGGGSVPSIPLENGDVFRVPSKPNTVNVIGSVYAQNVFLYNPERRVEDYVELAGNPNRIADKKHAFIIRADGSIFSRERANGVFKNTFDSTHINPGDSIVIPEKLIKPTALRNLLDYAQILSSFGLAAAAINVVR